MSSSPSKLIKFDKNKSLLDGNAAVGIDISSSAAQPDIGLALVNDSPFPARQIQLGQIAVNADAGKDIKFVNGAASVTFSASASANAGMGVYLDSTSLLSAVQLNDNLSPGVDLGTDANDIYMLLQWGYDLNASTKGAVAFGAPGSITFGGTASRDATYAII